MNQNPDKKLCDSDTYKIYSETNDLNLNADEYEYMEFNLEKSSYDFKKASSFSDLNSEIRQIGSNSVYNLDKDYAYKDTAAEKSLRAGIVIEADNITINGNGHIIDGQHKSSIFDIRGHSIKIHNLTFINAGYIEQTISDGIIKRQGYGCINWQGNYGHLDNCQFKDNVGLNGGIISLTGNETRISNILAENNTAIGVGGGIYISGNDNHIEDSYFINSYSQLTLESVFTDCQSQGNTFERVFSNALPYIDGKNTDIDVNFLNYSYNVTVADKSVDIISILYASILWNCQFPYDNDLTFYSSYSKITNDFCINFHRDFSNGFTIKKVFHLSMIKDMNQAFQALLNHDFTNELTLIKHLNVTNDDEYKKALSYNSDDLLDELGLQAIIDDWWFNPPESIVYALDVNFPNPITVNSNLNWNTENKNLDVININGHGSKIYIANNLKDEYKWATIKPNSVFCVRNLTLQGFNTAIEILGGSLILDNVILDGNKLKYAINRDWGGAILNAGYCLCKNCTFSNNYAKNGGAIFNQGLLELNDCIFSNNNAYGNGNDVLTADEAVVNVDGSRIECSQGPIQTAKSLSEFERIVLKSFTYLSSFAIGFIAGFISANPVIGMAIGATIGAGLGALSAGVIIANTYDINFNRFSTALELITVSMSAGMLGGAIGGNLGRLLIRTYDMVFDYFEPPTNELHTVKILPGQMLGGDPIGKKLFFRDMPSIGLEAGTYEIVAVGSEPNTYTIKLVELFSDMLAAIR